MKDAEREGQVKSHGSKTTTHRENEGGLPGEGGIGILKDEKNWMGGDRDTHVPQEEQKMEGLGRGKAQQSVPKDSTP